MKMFNANERSVPLCNQPWKQTQKLPCCPLPAIPGEERTALRPGPSAALDGESLYLHLWCQEDNRDKPRYLHDNEPVYTDSCLEAFLACYPQRSEEYVNFEVNRAGAMLMQRGTGRADRVFLTASEFPGVPFPKAEAFEHETGWGVRICVPMRFLQTLYGADSLPDLAAMRGNFYKCSEIPDREHYACWAPIQAPAPDFHRPECFRPFWDKETGDASAR